MELVRSWKRLRSKTEAAGIESKMLQRVVGRITVVLRFAVSFFPCAPVDQPKNGGGNGRSAVSRDRDENNNCTRWRVNFVPRSRRNLSRRTGFKSAVVVVKSEHSRQIHYILGSAYLCPARKRARVRARTCPRVSLLLQSETSGFFLSGDF